MTRFSFRPVEPRARDRGNSVNNKNTAASPRREPEIARRGRG